MKRRRVWVLCVREWHFDSLHISRICGAAEWDDATGRSDGEEVILRYRRYATVTSYGLHYTAAAASRSSIRIGSIMAREWRDTCVCVRCDEDGTCKKS